MVGELGLAADVGQLHYPFAVPEDAVAPAGAGRILILFSSSASSSNDGEGEAKAQWPTSSPCRRPPLLLGRHVLAGVGVGVPRVLVRRGEEDLALVPPSEHPALPFGLELLNALDLNRNARCLLACCIALHGFTTYLILLEESGPVVGLDELLGLRVAQSDPVVEVA